MAKIHRYIQMSMQRSQFFAVFLRTRCNRNTGSATKLDNFIEASQCDHIGQFIGFWGNFLKPLATINLPKSSSFFGNFCKGVKIYHFPSKIILGQLYQTFGDFVLVTLKPVDFLHQRFGHTGDSKQSLHFAFTTKHSESSQFQSN